MLPEDPREVQYIFDCIRTDQGKERMSVVFEVFNSIESRKNYFCVPSYYHGKLMSSGAEINFGTRNSAWPGSMRKRRDSDARTAKISTRGVFVDETLTILAHGCYIMRDDRAIGPTVWSPGTAYAGLSLDRAWWYPWTTHRLCHQLGTWWLNTSGSKSLTCKNMHSLVRCPDGNL